MDCVLSLSSRPYLGMVLSLVGHATLILVLLRLPEASRPALAPRGLEKLGGISIVELSTPASAPSSLTDFKDRVAVKQPPLTRKTEPSRVAATKETPPSTTTTTRQSLGGVDGGSIDRSSEPLGESDGVEVAARDRYLYELRLMIERRKIYPPIAKRRGETGRAVLQFSIDRDGSIHDAVISASSGFMSLDQASLQLIAELKSFKPFPDSIESEEIRTTVPIEYSLE